MSSTICCCRSSSGSPNTVLGRDIQRVITSHADAAKIGRKIADEVNIETVSSFKDAGLAAASWHFWQLLAKLTILAKLNMLGKSIFWYFQSFTSLLLSTESLSNLFKWNCCRPPIDFVINWCSTPFKPFHLNHSCFRAESLKLNWNNVLGF